MSLSLEGKIAIVTGASRSRGIGAQVAYELAKRGAKVSAHTLVPTYLTLGLFDSLSHHNTWLIYHIYLYIYRLP